MNKAIIIGHLGSDPGPDLKWIDKDNCVLKFRLATNERWISNGEKKTRTDWHTITAWGKRAEAIAKFAKKGHRLTVIGRLRNNNYTTKEGAKVFGYDITLEEFEFLSSSSENGTTTEVPENSKHDDASLPLDDAYSPPPLNKNDDTKDDIPF